MFEKFELVMSMFICGFFSRLKSIAGGINSRTLPIIFTVVQSERTSISSNMYTDRNARNT